MSDEVDDTDMTPAQFRAARKRGTPIKVVTSRAEFEATTRWGGARFEVFEDHAGSFRFRLKAGDGQVLATGEEYVTKAEAVRAAEAVMAASVGALIVDAAS